MRYEPSSRPRLLCPLFIPGNRRDMLAKASRFDASAFVPDLEDSVPSAAKDDAVEATVRAMPELVAIGKPIIPRVNGLTTGRTQSELEAVVGTGIVGISIGKVNSGEDIRQVSDMIDSIEKTQGVKPGATLILPWIETAAAVVNAYDICSASPRVGWVAFGAEDYAADMGIMREVDTDPPWQDPADEYGEASLLYARSAVAVAARAAGVEALDTPYVKFRDSEGLKSEANLARRLGYTGKFAIHPAQIDTIRSVWMPSVAEIARAKRVIDAANTASAQGRGAISLDGEMIDAPVVARAWNILLEAGLAPMHRDSDYEGEQSR